MSPEFPLPDNILSTPPSENRGEEDPPLIVEQSDDPIPIEVKFVLFPAHPVASQQRKHPVMVYKIPGNDAGCYEFSFKRALRDGSNVYQCCGCDVVRYRAKRGEEERKPSVVTIKVRDEQFLVDPTSLEHACVPRNLAQYAMFRKIIKVGDELRNNSDGRQPGEIRKEIIEKMHEDPLFQDLSMEEKCIALNQLDVGTSGRGSSNFARNVQRNRKAKRDAIVQQKQSSEEMPSSSKRRKEIFEPETSQQGEEEDTEDGNSDDIVDILS